MKRALAMVALMTLGGCQCFDAAYRDYCAADAGRCGTHGLMLAVTDGDARGCIQGSVSFFDVDGVETEAGMGTLNIASPTGATIFDTSCTNEQGGYPIHQPIFRFDFGVRTDTFGVHSVIADFPGFPQGETIFTANADLTWLPIPPLAQLPRNTCAPVGTLEVRERRMGTPTTSPLPTAITLQLAEPGDLTFGLSASSCGLASGSQVTLGPNSEALTLYGRTSADAGTEFQVTAEADAFGVLGRPTLRLFAECRPIGTECNQPTHCCSGNCTAVDGCQP